MAARAAPAPPDFPPEADAGRLAAGTHDAPFSVLGPHARDGARVIAAVHPGAAALWAVAGGAPHPLARHPAAPSVFAGRVPGSGAYRLRAQAPDGTVREADDPYRFGPVLGERDEHLAGEGAHRRLWQVLGAHVMRHEGTAGVQFAVWAPDAARVSVVGPFNGWDGRRMPMRRRGSSGIWEIFLPGLGEGAVYQYEILGPDGALQPLKADPVGFGAEPPPATASVVRDLSGHDWRDGDWMAARAGRNGREAAISIYEVHLGSWKRLSGDGNRALSYREAARELVGYASDMGFTHIEFLPLAEHPFEGSWGYQPIGLYAPARRHGPPAGLRELVEAAHAAGLGVLADWVPGHFPTDLHGLMRFDGAPLYEYADPREGVHRDWDTLVYDYARPGVVDFLVSNALYWLEEYHLDGLRVDAVASMLYRDYSREPGAWLPNIHGGNENLEAIAMLRQMNVTAYGAAPGAMTVAEESTSFPGVSTPVHDGGLGFGYKWNMGWMNDTLGYIRRDPADRAGRSHEMTGGLGYAFTENFILPISHDEVVYGKGSMLGKMPGEGGDRFASLRAYYGFMWGHPGKKLLFMGQEFGQPAEWDHDAELDWAAAARPAHAGLSRLVRDLNTLYRGTPALHLRDCMPEGFEWIAAGEGDGTALAWLRRGAAGDAPVAVLCNFAAAERRDWRCGLPRPGRWREVLNTDAGLYGGDNRGNMGAVTATGRPHHGQPASAAVTLPPLSAVFLIHAPG